MNDNFTEDSFMTEENMARMRKKIAEGNQLCWTSTVETFLNAFIFDEHQSDVQLVVPEYQRDYAWECIEKRERSGGISKKKGKNNQLALFFQDLAKVNSGTAYHLGTEFQRLRHLCEYKGLTLHKSQIPKKNIWLLCHLLRRSVVEAGLLKPYLAQKVSQQRTLKDGELNECLGVEQDPFVSITQQIINGEDFFEYARTYASLEQRLFEKTEPTGTIIKMFQTFYNRFSPLSRTDAYARDVYKTFVLLTVDNFGEEGLNRLYKPLWILAYYERILNGSLRFATAGETYGKKVCRLLAMKGSIEEVAMEIAILADEAKKQLDMETNSANYRGIERFLERYEKFKNIEFCERCAGCEWGEK